METEAVKNRARARLKNAVQRGDIRKPWRCEKCGTRMPKKKIHGHHYAGYKEWWNVMWLCPTCHREEDLHKMIFLGTSNGESKLNDDLVRYARKMRLRGIRFDDIAAVFGVSDNTIRQAIHRKTWKHVK